MFYRMEELIVDYKYIHIYITEQRPGRPGGWPRPSAARTGPLFWRFVFVEAFGGFSSVSRQLSGNFGGAWRRSQVLFGIFFGR